MVMRIHHSAIKSIVHLPGALLSAFICFCPGQLGYHLRNLYWRRKLFFLGERVRIEVGVHFQKPQYISIDDDCWIDRYVTILAGPDRSNRSRKYIKNAHFVKERGTVWIGKRNHIAPFCLLSGIGGIELKDDCNIAVGSKLYSFSHHYRSLDNSQDRTVVFSPLVPHDRQFMIEGPIVLKENTGVGMNSIILPGVSIGKDSFVALNSIVQSSSGENSFLQGSPAQVIKSRYEE